MIFQTIFGVFILILLKIYINGGKCLVKRDLTGKIAIVTGGNQGNGSETVAGLLQNHCKVIIGARDRHKAQKLILKLKNKNENISVEFWELDLGSKKSIFEFGEKAKSLNKIDLLINNAGISCAQKSCTEDGFESQFGINHLGHFYLTYCLWPLIKNQNEFRVITVSSRHNNRIKFTKDISYNPKHSYLYRYSRSKLANVLFTKALAKKLNKRNNSRVLCLHPGVVQTQIIRQLKLGFLLFLLSPFVWYFTKSKKQGCQTTLYCALEKSQNLENGGYYKDCQFISQLLNVLEDKLVSFRNNF